MKYTVLVIAFLISTISCASVVSTSFPDGWGPAVSCPTAGGTFCPLIQIPVPGTATASISKVYVSFAQEMLIPQRTISIRIYDRLNDRVVAQLNNVYNQKITLNDLGVISNQTTGPTILEVQAIGDSANYLGNVMVVFA